MKFVEDFSDLIFICGLIGCAVWNICRMFVFGTITEPDIINQNKYINLLLVVYMLIVSYLIYVHMSEGDQNKVLSHYAGFTNTDFGKVYFLLFAAMLVFPFESTCMHGVGTCENNSWVNFGVGIGLSAVASVNIMSICKKKRTKREDAKEEAKQKAMLAQGLVLVDNEKQPASTPS
tara:strand:+ start:282 stop:809 length:528 start_codon:yes stop_codon:yes gene_type:complete